MPEDMKLHITAFQDSAVLLTFVVAKEDTQMRNIFKNYPQNKCKQNPVSSHGKGMNIKQFFSDSRLTHLIQC